MQDNILNFFRRDNNDYATAWSMLREGRAEEALALAKTLSAKGDGHAYALMGMIYDYGLGGVKIDKSRAASYYQEAIDRCGSIAATRGLAKLLFFGDGLRQDLVESFRVYSALVQHTEDPMSRLAMGTMLVNGIGVEKNEGQGMLLLEVAAKHGYVEAYKILAGIYKQKKKWLKLAVLQSQLLGLRLSSMLVKKKLPVSDWNDESNRSKP